MQQFFGSPKAFLMKPKKVNQNLSLTSTYFTRTLQKQPLGWYSLQSPNFNQTLQISKPVFNKNTFPAGSSLIYYITATVNNHLYEQNFIFQATICQVPSVAMTW